MAKLVKCTPNLGILSFMQSPYLNINGSIMPKNQTIFIVFTLALFWLPILLCILGITQLILIVFFEKKKRKYHSWSASPLFLDMAWIKHIWALTFLFKNWIFFFVADVWNRTQSRSSLLELSHHIKSLEECECKNILKSMWF